MARRILLLLPFIQAIGIFGVMVWFHKGGLPESLSEADQTYVLQQCQIEESRITQLIHGAKFLLRGQRIQDSLWSLMIFDLGISKKEPFKLSRS